MNRIKVETFGLVIMMDNDHCDVHLDSRVRKTRSEEKWTADVRRRRTNTRPQDKTPSPKDTDEETQTDDEGMAMLRALLFLNQHLVSASKYLHAKAL